jgi:hypothetical protein
MVLAALLGTAICITPCMAQDGLLRAAIPSAPEPCFSSDAPVAIPAPDPPDRDFLGSAQIPAPPSDPVCDPIERMGPLV